MQTHFQHGRIGSLSWNDTLISSGTRDGVLVNLDIRSQQEISRIQAHRQEICGIEWSEDGQYLATGGNDNKVTILTAHSQNCVGVLRGHTAAVKALGWYPHQQGILATGGGTADKTLKLWNTFSMNEIASVDSHSQVCNLVFSKNTQELVTSHGYSQNFVIVWKVGGLRKLGMLTGHNKRVLYLDISPDGESIVTGAGDETLRFWRLFPKQEDFNEQLSCFSVSLNEVR